MLWRYHCRIDHDFWPLDNGNVFIHTITDNMCPLLGNELIRQPYLLEVTPQKELLWEWKGEEHVQELVDLGVLQVPIDWDAKIEQEFAQRSEWQEAVQNATPSQLAAAKQARKQSFTFDWAHNNTCQVIGENCAGANDSRFRPGNIFFSYRTLDIIGVIDRDSGEIVWAWGPGVIDGQHKPHMLPNGHILIFDNGTRRAYSRVVELDPLSEEIVWQYIGEPKESFFSPSISGAQRLPNDNTLSCDPDGWSGNYPVAYWDSRWKDLMIYGAEGASGPFVSALDEVLLDGFDGIYLDWVEGYEDSAVMAAGQAAGVDTAAEMVALIREIRDYARARDPDFLIIQQNAAALSQLHPELLQLVDAIAQEGVWFDGQGDGDWSDSQGYDQPTDPDLTSYYIEHLDRHLAADLPVFVCECALGHADQAYQNAYRQGYVPYVTRRSLSRLSTTPPPEG